MIRFEDIGWVVLIGALLGWLARRLGATRRLTTLAAATGGVVATLPLSPPISGVLRGMFGELSVGSWMLLAALLWLVVGRRWPIPRRESMPAALGIVLVAIPLYATSLGWGPMGAWDLYGLGYTGIGLTAAAGILGALAAGFGRLWIGIWLGLACLAFAGGIFPSTNLWDYLIDFPLVLIAIFFLLTAAVRKGIANRGIGPSLGNESG